MGIDFAFLDSGVGGIPYMKQLLETRPGSSCVYTADTIHFPYGEKTPDEIIENASSVVERIIKKWNPKAVVIACNTISVTALEELRKRFPSVPFVGTVPAIKPAAAISKTKKIGLLATNATINHPYTQKLICDFASDCQVFKRADPDLISFIEHKYFISSEEEKMAAIKPAVDFFKKSFCDVIVLACTHFLNMAEDFRKASSPSIKVVDSRLGVVHHAIEVSGLNKEISLKYSFQNAKTENKSNGKLFVTGFSESNDTESYEEFCRNMNVDFGGLLS